MDLRFKKIMDYDERELEYAIHIAVECCKSRENLSFWDICRGIDAYFEKRKRKEELEHDKEVERSLKSLSHK